MRFATLIAITGFLTCCVSVKLAQQEAKRASGVKFQEPASPFNRESNKDVDASWQNPRNGNLMSYLSDCQDDNDPTLESITQGALGGITDLKYDKQSTESVQGREGRRVLVTGNVDGVKSKIDMLAFKRDNCIYILSYVGVEKSFSADHAAFDKFIQGFRAP
jgi:hypothetical protein